MESEVKKTAENICLSLKGISKSYPRVPGEGAHSGRKNTLSQVSIDVRKGEIYGFIGLNGAGKTTAIKIALGLAHPDCGEVTFFSEPFNSETLKKVGYSPEKPGFYEFLTGNEILDFGVRLLNFPIDRKRKEEVLHTVGLWGDQNKKIGSYSKGMQQRLALALTMLHDPEVYILDEPSSGLDPLGRRMIKRLLTDIRKAGKTIFFSTHILADVTEICDQIGVIHEGCMLFEGSLSDFNPQKIDLEECFVNKVRQEPIESAGEAPKEA